jgi:hypothetical protein
MREITPKERVPTLVPVFNKIESYYFGDEPEDNEGVTDYEMWYGVTFYYEPK